MKAAQILDRPGVDTSYEAYVSAMRMVYGSRFLGYGLNLTQREFVRFRTKREPEDIPDEEVCAFIAQEGMDFYSPDFREPSLGDFDITTWIECRNFWVREAIARRGYPVDLGVKPKAYEIWLKKWGTHYENRCVAVENG